MPIEQARNSRFDLRTQHVVTTPEGKWRDFDGLPIELKRFLWFASQDLAIDPRRPNDISALRARERERVRTTALKLYGPTHPQAQGATAQGIDDEPRSTRARPARYSQRDRQPRGDALRR